MDAKNSLMGRLLGNAEKFSDKQVAETLAMLVAHGVKRGASDIHIEPHERFVLVRYRIDGTLRGMHKLPRPALGIVMAQLKTLAGLDIQETHLPQEGEYEQTVDDRHLEVHVATMPVYGGEKAVLHLTDEPGAPVELAEIGFWGEGLATLERVLTSPHGLVIVAGPNHSGVSSTLFSLLQDLNSPLVSVATVETNIKHRLPGINQTYLAKGMSMREGLGAALKQDPNIMMIDAMPDASTAELTVRAATTGHLVLIGLHANDSVSALLRLKHAGVEPFLLATGLRASVGQRLVRKLCTECRERFAISPEERQQLETSFGITTPASRKRIHELEKSAAPTIRGDATQLGSTDTQITHLWRASQTGCSTCEYTGHKGNGAIVEVLANTDTLHKALLQLDIISASTLQNMLTKDGFVSMKLDGLIKALCGQTTVAEVLRATTD